MRKLKRTRDYDFQLQIKNPNFIRPPLDSQRNWLLNKAMAEFANDLQALDQLATRFVPGAPNTIPFKGTEEELSDDDIMENWQIPLMKAMAEIVTEEPGDVLEIGFGRGISAEFIQDGAPKSHTIVECNTSVIERFHNWRADHATADIRLIPGLWQEVTDQFGIYDSIFFHTYPLTPEEYAELVLKSTTFAEHFFPTASAHLREGGTFTYLTTEIDSLSRAHQRLIFKYFQAFALQIIKFDLPPDIHDAWWIDQMAIVKVTR
ncbi:MAG: class I SAM-dependent methyltransferase [Candidatus Promineifilaceae bacterium]|nr:class I SAM-dependent methyltransferase [Candidatus Promineifilaceae bacterium]